MGGFYSGASVAGRPTADLVARTLPRRVLDRIQAEVEAESARFRKQLNEQFRGQPP